MVASLNDESTEITEKFFTNASTYVGFANFLQMAAVSKKHPVVVCTVASVVAGTSLPLPSVVYGVIPVIYFILMTSSPV